MTHVRRAENSADVLRDPETGEAFVRDSAATEHQRDGGTSTLRGTSRTIPVLRGVALVRKELATPKVIRYAREGRFLPAAACALKADGYSVAVTLDLLWRLRWPRFLQFNGSPCGGAGKARGYFRYRYAAQDAPVNIGILSCLDRTASNDGYLLDVGCGLAHFYQYYLYAYPPHRIVLLDRSLGSLLAVSCFVDRRTSIVCADAEDRLPFPGGAFLDVVALDTFRQLRNPQRFAAEARRLLDEHRGTMWLTHNPNPALTNNVSASRRPSEWLAAFDSDRWRLFPDAHFSQSVMHGGPINLGVNYAAQDDATLWRTYTVAYSNASWATHNRFVPLNRAPELRRLRVNSIYCFTTSGRSLVKRAIRPNPADSHDQYGRFELPERVDFPIANDTDRERLLRASAESLVMVESLCGYTEASVGAMLTLQKRRLKAYLKQTSWFNALSPFIPRALRRFGTRLLDNR